MPQSSKVYAATTKPIWQLESLCTATKCPAKRQNIPDACNQGVQSGLKAGKVNLKRWHWASELKKHRGKGEWRTRDEKDQVLRRLQGQAGLENHELDSVGVMRNNLSVSHLIRWVPQVLLCATISSMQWDGEKWLERHRGSGKDGISDHGID